MTMVTRSIRLSVAALAGIAVSVLVSPVMAQVRPEAFSFPVGLNPNGDNWLALRSMPSSVEGSRVAKLGPDTLFSEIGRAGEWAHVRLLSGDTGWVSARYVSCCRTAIAGADAPGSVVAANSCGDLWY